MSEVTIRAARDRAVVADLAALDSAPPLAGDVLVAELCGRAVAALELATGRTVADPFVRTANLVEMLRLRARGAPGPAGRRPGRHEFLPRPA